MQLRHVRKMNEEEQEQKRKKERGIILGNSRAIMYTYILEICSSPGIDK